MRRSDDSRRKWASGRAGRSAAGLGNARTPRRRVAAARPRPGTAIAATGTAGPTKHSRSRLWKNPDQPPDRQRDKAGLDRQHDPASGAPTCSKKPLRGCSTGKGEPGKQPSTVDQLGPGPCCTSKPSLPLQTRIRAHPHQPLPAARGTPNRSTRSIRMTNTKIGDHPRIKSTVVGDRTSNYAL